MTKYRAATDMDLYRAVWEVVGHDRDDGTGGLHVVVAVDLALRDAEADAADGGERKGEPS